jgi:NADPH-dependent 2,4-dienoyl-CoA reductase/sulfur reductase-like enzyme/nitrite reductase/ring-hydroxylating ferredoxin subunit
LDQTVDFEGAIVSAEQAEATGPDFSGGIPIESIPDGGMVGGHVGGKPVILSRLGEQVFAIGAQCTHYGGPLAEGIVVDGTVRCPWHHACFDLRTGEAVCAPALNPVARWETSRSGAIVTVTREIAQPDGATPIADRVPASDPPERIVIVGAGAAGNAAAEMLRRDGYRGSLTLVGGDESVPYDRPNLSKDYLAGSAPEEWIPLRAPEFYSGHEIELLRGVTVVSIDVEKRRIEMSNGESREFDRLLLATGADPVRLSIPGAELDNVHYLRTLADSRSIIAAAEGAGKAVVVGASFIGLEVAASLRARGLDVHVIAPESIPLERILGPEIGRFVKSTHESEGVTFHLGRASKEISPSGVTLDDGSTLDADLVVVGVGVRPAMSLAEKAGARIDRGVVVNEFLETSIKGIFAAGDIARYPDPRSGDSVRIEHWVVAERQGQTAARNMIGRSEKFTSVPFFWSNHYSTSISYVGHAEKWDEILVDGDIGDGEFLAGYRLGDRILAVAASGRERDSLRAEAAMEGMDWRALDAMFTTGK